MFQFEVVSAHDNSSSDGVNICQDDTHEDVVFNLNDLVVCEEHVGVVKYVGDVQGHPGIWIGVQWKDAQRGKHSGSVNGVRYFDVDVPNSASFVRPRKLLKLKNIMEAISERYESDDLSLKSIKSIEDRLEKNKRELRDLKVLNLSSKGINDLNDYALCVETCPAVEVLEISNNFITDWNGLGNLCKGWKNLKSVDFSRNPLPPPEAQTCQEHLDSFSKVELLVLGNLSYTWDSIMLLAPLFMNINSLTVSFNSISTIFMRENNFANLRNLDLEGNAIEDWKEVLKLGCLNLEYLNLCRNKISRIYLNEESESSFSNLCRLNISENQIDNWKSVSALDQFANLKEVRMEGNPVLATYKRATSRQITIARVKNLQKLEGVEISKSERRDAELDYVKLFTRDWSNVEQRELFQLEHPRFHLLLEKYGYSEVDHKPSKEKQTLQSNLINLIIVAASSLTYKEKEKRVLKTMTVQKLKGMLQRLFGLPQVPHTLTVTSCKNPEVQFILDDDFTEIGQYSVEDGDTIRLTW